MRRTTDGYTPATLKHQEAEYQMAIYRHTKRLEICCSSAVAALLISFLGVAGYALGIVLANF